MPLECLKTHDKSEQSQNIMKVFAVQFVRWQIPVHSIQFDVIMRFVLIAYNYQLKI